MARLLSYNAESGEFTEVTCEDLDDYYKHLECDTFDIATRKVDGKYYDIFCNDEGLFKEQPIISALNSDMEPMLVGNLIFANHDWEGNTTSLTDEDIRHIRHSVIRCLTVSPNGEGEAMLRNIMYPVEF